ncbi:MAG: TylF/MycF/NovP-related O-methyltransferase [Nitrosotalea sp.]
MSKQLFRIKTNLISSDFDKVIQDELDWYNKMHYTVQDSQEAIDVASVCKFILDRENVEGDILELGVEYAGFTVIIGDFLKRIGSKKHLYGADTFEGFPYDDELTLNGKKGASKGLDYEDAIEKIKKYGVNDKVTLLKGLFEDTLYQKIGDKKFSVVFMDCNLYQSTKFGLEFSYPRLSQGGVIAFDEYEEEKKGKPYHGETVAAKEFCVKTGIKINLIPIPHIKK